MKSAYTGIIGQPVPDKGMTRADCDRISGRVPGDLGLTDIIDVAILQKIQDSFALANDVASIIIDTGGRPITKPGNFNKVCELVKQTEKGRRRCDLSDADRNKLVRSKIRPGYHQCYSCGFMDAGAPIYVGDRHVADWLIGQCDVMNVGPDKMAEYAIDIGADVDAILEAYARMPRISMADFQKRLQLLRDIADGISRLCYNNLLLADEIRQRKQAESKFEISKSQYQDLFSSVMEGICIVDEFDKIIFANPALARLFGSDSTDDLINKCIYDLVDGEQIKQLENQRSNRKNGRASQYTLRQKNCRQEMVDIIISAAPRYDENGQYKGSFSIIVDITEKKRLEGFASRAQRLEAAGRIAAQVSHDFNNLLGPLIAYPDLIKKYLPDDSPAVELLGDIEIAATMMIDINKQLLTLGRRGHYNIEIIDLNELMKRSLAGLKARLETIEVETDLSPDLMKIQGGASQIARVISNLVHNALDAMQPSGRLIIKSENYYMDGLSNKYNHIPRGEYVKLTITDNGVGIPESNMPFIFDPFYTTKSADKKRGSGLGLSVVHAVMEDHEGYIDIASRPGRGTSVFLYFPIIRETSQPAESAAILGGDERVLVIDDDKMQREVTSTLLAKLGYEVSKAENCDEALNIIRALPHDLLVVDMVMPDPMDGAKIYGEILKLNPSQKAIIVSGLSESERIDEALRMGAGAFLKKPLTLKSLAQAVRHELDRPKNPN